MGAKPALEVSWAEDHERKPMFSSQPSSLQISDHVEGSGLTQWKWSPSWVSEMLPSQL